jgi:hypothetical protein
MEITGSDSRYRKCVKYTGDADSKFYFKMLFSNFAEILNNVFQSQSEHAYVLPVFVSTKG